MLEIVGLSVLVPRPSIGLSRGWDCGMRAALGLASSSASRSCACSHCSVKKVAVTTLGKVDGAFIS